ncbi:MAG: dihydrofolate reductase [Bacteroidia bacterium]|nr:dihydrofolate reductase [Bacteroidia bacterium]NNM16248.1 dihydrofolate reductase [Bacteroidia bacterium]
MTQKQTISIIAAVAENGVIGKDNQLIWHLPEDLKFFKRLTSGNSIIMGRKTYESIGKALPKRTNIVITRKKDYEAPSCKVVGSFTAAIEAAPENENIFIIGGATIYKVALNHSDKMYLTRVKAEFDGDVSFPEIDWDEWKLVGKQNYEKDEKHDYAFCIEEYDFVA